MSMRKSAPLILLFGLTFSLSLRADEFLQGLLHLERGNYKEAGKQLEFYFEKETDTIKKAKTAMVLAFAEAKDLKNMPVYYGKYALKYYPELTAEKRLKIYRRIGDYYFEIGDLKSAKETYQILNAESLELDPKIYDYSIYKMGWCLVNDGQYEKTFELWEKHLKNHQKGLLRENMIRDYGKFWAEYTYEKGNFPKLNPSFESNQERIVFLEGVKDGHLRGYRKRPELFFELAKKAGPLGPELSVLLKTQTAFQDNPCEVFKWNKAYPQNVLEEEALAPYLAKCSHVQKKSNTPLDQETLNFLSSLHWDSSNKVLLGILLGAHEDKKHACHTFISGATESLGFQEKLVVMEGILKNCESSLLQDQLTQIKQFTIGILSSEELARPAQEATMVIETILAFLGSPMLSDLLLDEVLRNHAFFTHRSKARLALLIAFVEDSILFPILFEGWPKKDSETQEVLTKHLIWAIEQKSQSYYLPLIEKYVDQKGTQVPLLYLWSLDVPLPEYLVIKAQQEMNVLQNECSTQKDLGRKVLLNFAFTKQSIEMLLNNWSCLEKDIFADPKLVSRILGMIILNGDDIAKNNKFLKSNEFIGYGVLLAKIGKGQVGPRALNLNPPQVLKKTKILKDIDLLKKAAKFKQRISGKKTLGEKTLVEILKGAVLLQKSIAKRVWESPEIMSLTTQIYNQEIDRLKSTIEQRKDLSMPKEQLTKAFENLRLAL